MVLTMAISSTRSQGRQLDGARAPIEVLQEIRRERPDLCDKMEIYVDGGIRRGTDVLKALCLGAKAVGIGRPFLYAQSAYGPDGVVKVVESECIVGICSRRFEAERFALAVLKEEMATGMRLLGVNNVSELKPALVDCLPLS
jgi:L-lactate dehydrogenase (cytochrome)